VTVSLPDLCHDLTNVAAALEAVVDDMTLDRPALERARGLQLKCTKRLREIIAEVSQYARFNR